VERVRHLIVGAGISGLAFADWLDGGDYLILEADAEPGGYCKTVTKDGFTWDYSGHFFHFRHPEIEKYLVERMEGQRVLEVEKASRIFFDGTYVDFPFQKNIHQLPKQDFIDCLVDLYFREDRPVESFLDMLYARFGRSIAEKFLVPYNEKLYATDLRALDVDAMGRFFPYADVDEIVANFRRSDNRSYNATFTYPEGGAIQYVHALMRGVEAERVALSEPVVAIDLRRKIARTPRREVAFDRLVSTIPFVRLLELAGVPHDRAVYTYNKVQVFNLGFDRKGPSDVHWIYYPQRELSFYRVGFYDNIFGTDRMSLYVEIGRRPDETIDDAERDRALERVLSDLTHVGLVDGHGLVSSHHVVLDPAYVHITRESQRDVAQKKAILGAHGVHSIGRYGSWTYCSIEDNIVEARALAELFDAADQIG
jgi:protoporphyrinogen oxidase